VASILTGQYPSSHGGVSAVKPVSKSVVTLAEILSERGWATAGVVSHLVVNRANGFAQGFETWRQSEARGHGHVSTPGVTAQAVELLDALAAGDRPFFLFVHYFDPHYDYLRHAEYGFAAGRAGRLDGTETIQELRGMLGDLDDEEIAFIRDIYDEEIRFTDEHVPLLISGPGVAPGVIRSPVSQVSLTPTLLDLLGVETPEAGFEEPSLAHLLAGDAIRRIPGEGSAEGGADRGMPDAIRAEVSFDPPVKRDEAKGTFQTAVIAGRHKLIRDESSGAVSLYDLLADPGERRDIAGECPDIRDRLLALLDERKSAADGAAASQPTPAAGEPTPGGSTAGLSPDDLKKLSALGYDE
jgi:arylsulfatase A-like enzyme